MRKIKMIKRNVNCDDKKHYEIEVKVKKKKKRP